MCAPTITSNAITFCRGYQDFRFIWYLKAFRLILKIIIYFILAFSSFVAEKSCWPSMKTLFLLRLWSMIFPCSDFRHVVMTPAILLMCEYLTRCPIISGRDVAVGSFLCSMVLSVSALLRSLHFIITVLLNSVTWNFICSSEYHINHIYTPYSPTL